MKLFFSFFILLCIYFTNVLFPCTIFSIANDEKYAYVGNNGDSVDGTYNHCYVEPGLNGKYGAIYFGSDSDKQCGINDHGLMYVNAAIPYWKCYPVDSETLYEEGMKRKLMQECATVDEAVVLLKNRKTKLFAFVHTLIADRKGRSVLVEWNGENLEFIDKKGDFQLATNFLISKMKDENNVSCKRYSAARHLLINKIASMETCRDVLAATCQDHTTYSLIGDLVAGQIYLFTNHNYEDVAIIDITKELQKGAGVVDVSFFSNKPA